jgi:Uma2 family endonuclease
VDPKVLQLALSEGRKPAWELALLYPDQGSWTVEDYLRLDAGRHVEFAAGHVELQPMPDEKHQAIVFFLAAALKAFARRSGGKATLAPFPVRLWHEKFREPDVAYMSREHVGRCRGKYWEGADLAIEVLSESNPEDDTEVKRVEYARAGIPEYWIVDPEAERISVLVLDGGKYLTTAEYGRGTTAVAHTIAGFEVDVGAVFDAE